MYILVHVCFPTDPAQALLMGQWPTPQMPPAASVRAHAMWAANVVMLPMPPKPEYLCLMEIIISILNVYRKGLIFGFWFQKTFHRIFLKS